MFPMWVYFAVAAAIATVAFLIGQMFPGWGVAFVIGASSLWSAYSIVRSRRLGR